LDGWQGKERAQGRRRFTETLEPELGEVTPSAKTRGGLGEQRAKLRGVAAGIPRGHGRKIIQFVQ
jgi:hypothetical protein